MTAQAGTTSQRRRIYFIHAGSDQARKRTSPTIEWRIHPRFESSISLQRFTTHVALFALHMRLWHFSTVGLFASTVAQSGVDQYVLKETPIAQAGVLANIGPNGAKSSGAYVSFHP